SQLTRAFPARPYPKQLRRECISSPGGEEEVRSREYVSVRYPAASRQPLVGDAQSPEGEPMPYRGEARLVCAPSPQTGHIITMRQSRKLAAILVADVVGFSRLTADHEEDAL